MIFPFSVYPCASCQLLLCVAGNKISKMSARKLCSLIHKSNQQIVTLCRRTYSVNMSRNKIYSHHYNNKNNINPLSQKVYYSQALGSLTKDQAHDLVFRLNEEERATLLEQLEKFQLKEDKRKLECKS